jgi:hypothetical protein
MFNLIQGFRLVMNKVGIIVIAARKRRRSKSGTCGAIDALSKYRK